jgi:endonuclease/exonuclease/phosphatase family metal-dependent hydrolase
MAPTRVYHEILVAASEHPYKSESAPLPLGNDPVRPSALVSDGLNMFSQFPFDETLREAWATCVESASDCLALKGFSMARTQLADGVSVDIYNLHMEAGGTPEDDASRDMAVDQLVAFMLEHSQGEAIIVGGDFNLHTDSEPAGSQFARLLDEADLHDVCTELDCERPGSIDKFLFRSSDSVTIEAQSWRLETDVFVSDMDEPLSDHDPLAVRFAWSLAD